MGSKEDIIAEEWVERSGDLADWAMARLVNRKDVWGQYSVLTPTERRRTGKSYKAMTLPRPEMRGEDMVTLDKLTRHFASRHLRKPQIIGLHAKSKQETSRWFAIDIDMHDEGKTGAEDHARRNLDAAVTWCQRLQTQGYDPLLFNSNGYGGFHIWVLLEEPAPTAAVFAFVKSIAQGWKEVGLEEEPETFPKRVKEDSIGAWFRLPGLHHSRDWHSALWSWDDWLEDPWLHGHAAIDGMLAAMPGPPPPKVEGAEIAAPRRTLRALQPEGERFERAGKARVCVDLDGVLAQPVSGPLTEIGPPMDGALEFMRELASFAEITVLSSRLATTGASAKARRDAIAGWLAANGFPDAAIHDGPGKPPADAYIDDRAVPCRPLDDGLKAFAEALDRTRSLTGDA